MADRAIQITEPVDHRTSPIPELWDLDLDTQIIRLQALNRSEAGLAHAIRRMVGPCLNLRVKGTAPSGPRNGGGTPGSRHGT